MMADEENPLECLLHQAATQQHTAQTKRNIAAALESRGHQQHFLDEAAKKKRSFPLDFANRGSAFPMESAIANQAGKPFDLAALREQHPIVWKLHEQLASRPTQPAGFGLQEQRERALNPFQRPNSAIAQLRAAKAAPVAKNYSVEATVLIRKLSEKALRGETRAMRSLARLYSELGDEEEAELWLRTAAEAHDSAAQQEYGTILARRSSAQVRAQGVEWLTKAAKSGRSAALYELGALLVDGASPGLVSGASATKSHQSSHEQEHPYTQEQRREGLALVHKSAEQSHPPALFWFCEAHVLGKLGLEQDAAMARRYAERAAKHKFAPAIALLKILDAPSPHATSPHATEDSSRRSKKGNNKRGSKRDRQQQPPAVDAPEKKGSSSMMSMMMMMMMPPFPFSEALKQQQGSEPPMVVDHARLWALASVYQAIAARAAGATARAERELLEECAVEKTEVAEVTTEEVSKKRRANKKKKGPAKRRANKAAAVKAAAAKEPVKEDSSSASSSDDDDDEDDEEHAVVKRRASVEEGAGGAGERGAEEEDAAVICEEGAGERSAEEEAVVFAEEEEEEEAVVAVEEKEDVIIVAEEKKEAVVVVEEEEGEEKAVLPVVEEEAVVAVEEEAAVVVLEEKAVLPDFEEEEEEATNRAVESPPHVESTGEGETLLPVDWASLGLADVNPSDNASLAGALERAAEGPGASAEVLKALVDAAKGVVGLGKARKRAKMALVFALTQTPAVTQSKAKRVRRRKHPEEEEEDDKEEEEEEPPLRRKMGGLANATGENHCFVNVCVQALFRLAPFRERFRREAETTESEVVRCLSDVFEAIDGRKSSKGLPSAARLRRALGKPEIVIPASCRRRKRPAATAVSPTTINDGEFTRVVAAKRRSRGAPVVVAPPPVRQRQAQQRPRLDSLAESSSSSSSSDSEGSRRRRDEKRTRLTVEKAVEKVEEQTRLVDSDLSEDDSEPENMTQRIFGDVGAMADATEALELMLARLSEALRSSLVEDVFGTSLVECGECPRCGQHTAPLSFSTVVHYAHVATLVTTNGGSFDERLRELLRAEPVSCSNSQCAHVREVVLSRRATRLPAVLTVGLTWTAAHASRETVNRLLLKIDPNIDAKRFFDSTDETEASVYTLSGSLCFFGRHYVAFFRQEASGDWMMFDDGQVRHVGPTWADVAEKCTQATYQTVALFYVRGQPTAVSDDDDEDQTQDA